MRTAALGAGFAALAAWICLHPAADLLRDDVWMMRVADRILSGETLYRDVSFGVTPLSVYAMTGLGRFLGVELLAVRGVVAVAYCLALWWSVEAAGLLGAAAREKTLLAAGLIAFAIPAWSSGYSLLATAFLAGCFTAALRWQRNALPLHAFLAGILCGLTFCSKQNMGLAAIAALAASIAAGNWPGRRRIQAGFFAFAGFAATAVVCLFPVAASGAWTKFIEYGFTAKGAYVRLGALSYWDSLIELNRLSDWLRKPAFLAPAVLLPLGWLWLRAPRAGRPRATAVFAFSLAAAAGLYPRPDWWHLQPQLPILGVGIYWTWRRLSACRVETPSKIPPWRLASCWKYVGDIFILRCAPRRMPTRLDLPAPGPGLTTEPVPGQMARTAIRILLIAAAATALARPFAEAALESYAFAGLPHFRGIVMASEAREETRNRAARLKQATPEGEVFLLFPDASVYYLLSGLRNPTPFDYPYINTLGNYGEDELIEAIDRGHIRAVCTGAGADQLPLIPLKLLRHIERNMRPAADLGFCALYRGLRQSP